MRGYIPPFLPLSRSRIFTDPWPELVGGAVYAIKRFEHAVPWDAGEHPPVAGAMATLMRWLSMSADGDAWKDLSAGVVATAIAGGLGDPSTADRYSFSTAIRAIDIVPPSDLPEVLQGCGHHRDMPDRSGCKTRWPWTVDLIVTVPRSRMMLKLALAHAIPIAVGLSVTDRWTDAADVATGVVRTPAIDAQPTDGDCVVLDGWDDNKGCFSMWFMAGPEWGHGGRGWIPYEYVCSPLWVHELVMIPTV